MNEKNESTQIPCLARTEKKRSSIRNSYLAIMVTY